MRKKKVSMKNIADTLNVSINTVSLALNNKSGISDETRQSILQTAKELGYITASQPRPIHNIALLLNKRYIKSLSFYSRVVYGITDFANQNNYNVIVDFFSNDTLQLPQSIANNSVDGILTAGNIDDEFLMLLQKTGLPLISIDHISYHYPVGSIGTQNLQGGYQATQFIISQGHRNIGFVGDIHYSNNLRERWLGFCSCMEDNTDTKVSRDYASYSILSRIAPAVITKDYAAIAKEIKALPTLPTAWVCCNDETAICMYQALDLIGLRIGKDVSIIGFDDIENATLVQPALTTMHVPKKQLGESAFTHLCQRIENPTLPIQSITLPVYLVKRDSVKAQYKN